MKKEVAEIFLQRNKLFLVTSLRLLTDKNIDFETFRSMNDELMKKHKITFNTGLDETVFYNLCQQDITYKQPDQFAALCACYVDFQRAVYE